ncbi:unnamed protein product [Adineta ricciae]|uniref:G-protein coupled receptors family 1 profile domain-containing protein n=1 Tax=Adineta ricciae TaxID=249248 RepID=A0A815RFT1_ADIRI|nr:unnamed protein product [Adineta ricciae]
MSHNTSALIEKLELIRNWTDQIIPILLILFGSFGNVFNIIIFTRRELRTNPCSLYFLIGSINDCFVIGFGLLTRYLADNWDIDLSIVNNTFCKIRSFLTYPSLDFALWSVVLASIDRYLSSSPIVRFRRLSNLSIARKATLITIIVIYLSYTHTLVFYQKILTSNGISCTIISRGYFLFLTLFGSIISYILPIILMSIFGILMIYNVQNTHRHLNLHNRRLRSNDRQLSKMLLIQVLITIIISTPYHVITFYNTIAIITLKYRLSSTEFTIFKFLRNLSRYLIYTNSVHNFYIYTITSSKFREEFQRCLQHGKKAFIKYIQVIKYLPLKFQRIPRTENNDLRWTRSTRRNNVIIPIG